LEEIDCKSLEVTDCKRLRGFSFEGEGVFVSILSFILVGDSISFEDNISKSFLGVT